MLQQKSFMTNPLENNMPIIKRVETEMVSIKAKIPKSLETQIKAYIDLFQIEGIDQFIKQAAEYVLRSDPDWKKHCKKMHELR
jgi:hypothetical protein